MSVTEWLQEQEPSQVRLAKALSWHYPNREYLNSLLVEKQRQDLEYSISHLQRRNLNLNGPDSEKCETLRIQQKRLNSLMMAKSKTMSTGLNHTAFRKHKQELDKQFANDLSHETPKLCDIQYGYRPVPMDFGTVGKTTKVDTPAKKLNSPQGPPTDGKAIAKPGSTSSASNQQHRQPSNPQVPNLEPWEEAGAPQIPTGLSPEEQGVYKKLIGVRKRRGRQAPPRVVVITDLGKDYDDLAAMVVLKELHRLGLIRLEGFIANLHPPQTRAHFGRCALDLLGLRDIPIAWGEETETRPNKREPPHKYEFHDCKFMNYDSVMIPYNQDKPNNPGDVEIESGIKFLDRLVYERLPEQGGEPKQKLTFLLISGLSDIATYAKQEPEHLAAVTENIVLQGDYSIEQGPTSYNSSLKPNLSAANNSFDEEASKEVHDYMGNRHIPSVVVTKWAAVAASLCTEFFKDLAATNHPIGIHLQQIQTTQDLIFYDNACNGPRFREHMDQKWFLKTKTWWYKAYPEGHPQPLPVGAEVVPYLNILVYDALAALATPGPDVLRALDVLEPCELFANQGHHVHKIVGRAENIPDIEKDKMKLAITALMKGSLLACEQKIPSTRKTMKDWDAANAKAVLDAELGAEESAAIGTGI